MTAPHDDQRRAPGPPPELPAVISFDGPTRLALTLRMAGYSDDQVAKLIARGIRPEEMTEERRAA